MLTEWKMPVYSSCLVSLNHYTPQALKQLSSSLQILTDLWTWLWGEVIFCLFYRRQVTEDQELLFYIWFSCLFKRGGEKKKLTYNLFVTAGILPCTTSVRSPYSERQILELPSIIGIRIHPLMASVFNFILSSAFKDSFSWTVTPKKSLSYCLLTFRRPAALKLIPPV